MAFSGHGLPDEVMIGMNLSFSAYFIILYLRYMYCFLRYKINDLEKIKLTVKGEKVTKEGSSLKVSLSCIDLVYGGFFRDRKK